MQHELGSNPGSQCLNTIRLDCTQTACPDEPVEVLAGCGQDHTATARSFGGGSDQKWQQRLVVLHEVERKRGFRAAADARTVGVKNNGFRQWQDEAGGLWHVV